jgi:hypothetical protein
MLETSFMCMSTSRRHGSPNQPGDERARLWQSAPPMARTGQAPDKNPMAAKS